jgi:hypothetical protein
MDQQPDKITYRVAEKLREKILGLRDCKNGFLRHEIKELLDGSRRLESIRKQLDLCRRFSFASASTRVGDNLIYILRDIVFNCGEAQKLVSDRPLETHVSLRDIVSELTQLTEEFGKWDYKGREGTLSVTTEPVELEGTYLGPFEIRLHLDAIAELRRRPPYTVLALDPHPASSNDAITHPHVRDETLCEGEASAAIRAALQEGRICDLFLLVRSVLTTYNADSPYVRLEDWDGRPCSDCGCVVGGDDMYYCESCEEDVCSECVSCCSYCSSSLCQRCLETCPSCEERVCSDCRKSCASCGAACCKSCLEDGLCVSCHEEQEESDNETEQSADSSVEAGQEAAGAANSSDSSQPNSVEQAA